MSKTSTLFLERTKGERILINEGRNEIEMEVSRVRDNGTVTLVFRGPAHVKVDRLERRRAPSE
ncbi:carbon storage regulator [Kineobactrum salinum]|uniref:Carbon storage regulator n=1 Tax=Kineobactrum salinum TaxID=2708301 RepID=A0A6C0U948_9GAMM|nr:hypothetical protein G3T16_18705 [Kineobactrum salinum]